MTNLFEDVIAEGLLLICEEELGVEQARFIGDDGGVTNSVKLLSKTRLLRGTCLVKLIFDW